MPKVLHQRARCIGCNLCFEIWPLRWRMSHIDGKCTLVNGTEKKNIWQVIISEDEVPYNQKVALACPLKIITIIK